MKKKYEEPEFDLTEFSFERILEEAIQEGSDPEGQQQFDDI